MGSPLGQHWPFSSSKLFLILLGSRSSNALLTMLVFFIQLLGLIRHSLPFSSSIFDVNCSLSIEDVLVW